MQNKFTVKIKIVLTFWNKSYVMFSMTWMRTHSHRQQKRGTKKSGNGEGKGEDS